MKAKQPKKPSLTKRLIKKLTDQHRATSKKLNPTPAIQSDPLKSAELYQDPGAGYNPDHTFPQT